MNAYDDPCATCVHPLRWHVNEQTGATHCKDPDCPCRAYVTPLLAMGHVLNDRRLEWKP